MVLLLSARGSSERCGRVVKHFLSGGITMVPSYFCTVLCILGNMRLRSGVQSDRGRVVRTAGLWSLQSRRTAHGARLTLRPGRRILNIDIRLRTSGDSATSVAVHSVKLDTLVFGKIGKIS